MTSISTPSAAALAASGAVAGEWTLIPADTLIGLHSKSMWGMAKVNGRFASVKGSGHVAADGAVTGEIVIDSASVDTRHKKRDEHLRSKDFFDVARHPEITFTVEAVTPRDGARVEIRGALTVAGRREPLAFTASINEATSDSVAIEAELNVDRSRFGMSWSPMKVASMDNRITVKARFRREAR